MADEPLTECLIKLGSTAGGVVGAASGFPGKANPPSPPPPCTHTHTKLAGSRTNRIADEESLKA